MNKKQKILVVENDQFQFTIIKNVLEDEIGQSCIVYPTKVEHNTSENEDLEEFNDLIRKIINGKHQEVAKYYIHIDIFIIDIHLLSSSDQHGAALAKCILNDVPNSNIILISNDQGFDDTSYGYLLDEERISSFVKKGSYYSYAPKLALQVAELIDERLKQ